MPTRRQKHEETRPDEELVVTVKEPRTRVWTRRVLFGISAFGLLALVSFMVVGVLMVQAQRQTFSLPAPPGDYIVGRHVVEFADESRRNVGPSDSDQARTVFATVWYPAEAKLGDTAPYLPTYWREAFRKEMGMIGRTVSRDPASIRTQSYDEAPLSDGSFPVVAVVPTPGASAFDYTTLAEGLASKGYVTVVLTPAKYVDAVKRDGTLLRGDARRTLPDSDTASQAEVATAAALVTEVWKADLMGVLQRLSAPEGLLGGREDTSLTMVGQGLGGSVAFQVCKTQAQCVATLTIDGPILGNDRNVSIKVPTIALYSPGVQAENVRKYNDMVLQQQDASGYSLVSSELMWSEVTDVPIRSVRGLIDPPTRSKVIDALVETRDVLGEVIDAAQTPEKWTDLASHPPSGFRAETWGAIS